MKRVLFGGGAMVALSLAFLLGSVTLHSTFAAGPPTPPTSQGETQEGPDIDNQQPAYTGSIQVPQDQPGQSEQGEATALQSQAKITADEARAAALAQFPSAAVQAVTLENENGSLVYSVQLTDTAGKGQDVKVDAGNGNVLHAGADGPEGNETED